MKRDGKFKIHWQPAAKMFVIMWLKCISCNMDTIVILFLSPLRVCFSHIWWMSVCSVCAFFFSIVSFAFVPFVLLFASFSVNCYKNKGIDKGITNWHKLVFLFTHHAHFDHSYATSCQSFHFIMFLFSSHFLSLFFVRHHHCRKGGHHSLFAQKMFKNILYLTRFLACVRNFLKCSPMSSIFQNVNNDCYIILVTHKHIQCALYNRLDRWTYDAMDVRLIKFLCVRKGMNECFQMLTNVFRCVVNIVDWI